MTDSLFELNKGQSGACINVYIISIYYFKIVIFIQILMNISNLFNKQVKIATIILNNVIMR